MKKELQSNVNGVMSGGGSIQHPLSIHSASIGSRWKVHGLSLMMTILLLFTMGIGQMWADTFTASEIAAKSGDVNVGTTKNHVTVSSLGITSTTSTQIWVDNKTAQNEAAVVLSAEPTSSGDTYNKSASFVEIKADRGYALGSTLSVRGGSTQDGAKLAVIVYWDGEASPTFTSYDATNLSLGGKKQTSNPSDINLTVPEGTRTARIYKKVKVTDATNLISGNASSSKGNGYAAIVHVIATAVLSPEIDGVSQMFNDETITLTGYPAGGSWDVVSGPGAIASDGKLTASGNGTIRVSYTKDDKTGYKDITAAATKQITFDFTAGVLPTVSGFTLTNLSATFDGANGLKMGSNGQGVRISSTTYDFTNAIVSAKASSTSKKISYNLHANAVDVTNDPEFATVGTSFTEYNKDINSQIFTVFRSGGSTTNFNYIVLTVKKAVACTAVPTVSATTKGATTSTTQVVNCAGISSLGSEGCSISSYGFVYGTGETPNIDDDTQVEVGTSYSTINTAFAETTLTGLTASTTYYVRAYATNGSGTAYGDAVSFTTSDACTVVPTVSAISKGTTSYTTQVMNCAGITAIGSAGCAISSYGFVYGTAEHPTTENSTKEVGTSYTVVETAFAETTLTGLTPNTTYYVRAYATNEYGTAYSSNELSFTTLETIGNVAFIASSASVTNDAITALRDAGYNVTVRTKAASPDYTGVDLVVLDESLSWGSSSDEVGTVISADVPVLNLKAFFYTLSSRWNWGTPVNPSTSELATLSTEYTNISSHPIFDGVTITAGAVDMVNPSKSGNNLQGVTTSTLVEGKRGYTLATSATGTTCIHELTPAQRGVSTAKYLLIALSSNIKDNYSDDAKKMIVNAAKYLIGNTPWTPVIAPTLSSSVPANSATDVAVEGNIVLTFSENVTVLDASKFTLSGGAGSLTTASISVSGAAVTIPYTGLDNSTEYTLATAAGAVKNGSDVPNAALSNIVFTTEAACTKPEAPASLVASDIAYTSATLSWDPSGAGANGYKIALIKKDDESVILDWTDESTNSYSATGLTQGTEYTFKVKYKGDGITPGQCEFSNEATVDFTTTAPSVADLVTISDDYTFTPSAAIAAGTLSADSKFFAAGASDCDMSGGKMRVKTNRALAFKVADGAKIKVTFTANGSRQIQLGNSLTQDSNPEGNYYYGHSTTSPYTFDVVATGGVVYLTAYSDQLYFSTLEITYPHTVTYDLNGGTGDPTPTQASKYVGETFTAHDGITGITAPATKEFDKWVDQDAADVAAGTTYTMPAKNVTLTAQWRDVTVKYAVTYDLADYTAGVAPTETDKAEGDVFAIKAAPSRAGYAFMGWLCNIDAQTYQATNNYTMTAAPTTFTAQWQQFFTITYKDGDDVLDTEKVNVGSSPAGIADPTKELFSFVGWTLVPDGDVIDVTELAVSTTVYAKWTAFDGCAYLALETSGPEPSAGDAVLLKTSSFGGTAKVAGKNGSGSITYTENGLRLTGGGKDSIRVTLENKMRAGTKITVCLKADGDGARGLKLRKLDKTEVASLGWSSATSGAVKSFTYTVVADDGLDGKKAFILSRSNSVYLKYISVEDCAPEEFVVTYMDGETEMGTEDVYSGYHPTAAGVVTRKSGYAFEGWKETVDGAVKALNTITITADKTLYAEYSARDCSGNGVMFSQVAKANTLESDYSLSGTTEVSIGEYATVTGGEVYLNNNNGSTRVKITKTTSVIQLTGGDDGYIHVLLDCPLKTGDTIKADNTNKWVIAHNASKTDKVQLASGVHYFVVTDGWNNKGEFYIWRDGSACNISTIKVIRPAKYTVSFNMKGHGSAIADIENVLEGSKISAPSPAPTDEDYAFSGWYKENTLENEWDFANDVVTDDTELFAKWLDKSDATLKSLKYGDTDINLTTAVLDEGVYVFAVNVSPLATGVPALTAETSNPNASAAITNATEFDGERHATSTVVVTPEKSGAATKTYKVNFTKLQLYTELVDVTDHTEWSWAGVATDEVKISDVANRGLILANYIDAPNFEKLEGEANARAYRSTTYPAYQGKYLRLHATVPGKLTISVRNTSGSPKMYVNGSEVATLSSTKTDYSVIVPAGDVIITTVDNEMRIYAMVFSPLDELTPDYTRVTTQGRFGTICLPNGGGMVGAALFEVAYYDATVEKIYFDEILNGAMVAGRPYIFLPEEGIGALNVYYTDAANEDAGNYHGLYGSYTQQVLAQEAGNYILYNNQYMYVGASSSNVSVGANRAYFKIGVEGGIPTNAVAPLPGRRRVSMSAVRETPTGLENGELINGENGVQKVLINGELFILRGEKMYDATGRLVK